MHIYSQLITFRLDNSLCIGTSRAPYYIAYPQTDSQLFIFNSRQQDIDLICSLRNDSISYEVDISWLHNNNRITRNNEGKQRDRSTTLLIRNPQPSDAGIYQCVFNIYDRYQWRLKRNFVLLYGKLLQIASYSDYVTSLIHGILFMHAIIHFISDSHAPLERVHGYNSFH